MEGEEYSSISTGHFVVKPSKLKRSKLEFPMVYQEESNSSIDLRREWYNNTYKQVAKIIKNIIEETTLKVANDIVHHITLPTIDYLINTFILKVGINAMHYNVVYDLISERLSKQHKICSVCLDPSLLSTDIPSLLREIFNSTLADNQSQQKILLKTLSLPDLLLHLKDEGNHGFLLIIKNFMKLNIKDIEPFLSLLNSCQKDDFPIHLVLELSTGTEVSSEYMSNGLMSSLRVTNISLPPPTALLEKILSQTILMPHIPFKLSYESFEVLLSRFSLSTYSVQEIIKAIKITILHHAIHQPLVKLINFEDCSLDISKITDDEKDLVIQLPSMQKHIERLIVSDKATALKLLEGDGDSIANLFIECKSNYETLYHTYCVIHKLVKGIPGNSLVSKPLELFSLFLRGETSSVPEIRTALKCFGMLSCDEFWSRLQDAYYVLEPVESKSPKLQLLAKVIKMQIDKLISEEVTETTKDVLKNAQSTFVSRIDNFLSTLSCPGAWPLNELLWFTDHTAFQTLLVGKVRAAIHRGLSKPHVYLQYPAEDDSLIPNVCHLYRLYHEHGKLISLHDWIKSYVTSLGKKKVTQLDHARFFQAASELHFLGYIKPTRRKTDHFAKMSLLGY